MIHGSAAIINQGGGFLEQSRQGQGWPEKGTQFCFEQHLACEIGPRPAQLATRPVFWPSVPGPRFLLGGKGSRSARLAPARRPGRTSSAAWADQLGGRVFVARYTNTRELEPGSSNQGARAPGSACTRERVHQGARPELRALGNRPAKPEFNRIKSLIASSSCRTAT